MTVHADRQPDTSGYDWQCFFDFQNFHHGCWARFPRIANTPPCDGILSSLRSSLDGAVEGAHQGYRTIRSELGVLVPPKWSPTALRACRTEGGASPRPHAPSILWRALGAQ